VRRLTPRRLNAAACGADFTAAASVGCFPDGESGAQVLETVGAVASSYRKEKGIREANAEENMRNEEMKNKL
jgi:hypothetical protein